MARVARNVRPSVEESCHQSRQGKTDAMFLDANLETGRRRKVKCRPSNISSRCQACVARNARCVEQKRATPARKTPKRKDLYERIAVLEGLVRAQSDVSDDDGDDDVDYYKLSPASGRQTSEPKSVEDIWFGVGKQRSASPQRDGSLFPNALGPVTLASDHLVPSVQTTLFPIGSFKHEKDCKILLAVLKSVPDVQESLQKHSHFWAMKMSMTEPDASSAEKNILLYARQALSGDNPIKIAKIVQAVASGTKDEKLLEKLVLLVDRLIVSDDEYLSNLDGLECALDQGRLLTEMGQIRRSW
jgi:hypothetical protein